MKFNLKIAEKELILIIVPLLFEIVSFSFLFWALNATELDLKRETHARAVYDQLNTVTELVMKAVSSLYNSALGGGSEALTQYDESIKQIPERFQSLHSLLDSDPVHKKEIDVFQENVDRMLGYLDISRHAVTIGDLGTAVRALRDIREVSHNLTGGMDSSRRSFRNLAESRSKLTEEARQKLKIALLFAIASSVLLAIALYVYFYRDTSFRLGRLLDNTNRFAGGEQLNPPLEGTDEIAHLDQVFHEMTETITRAMREKQEFMAMITHDIRSPLSGVIGSLALLSEPRMGFNLSRDALDVVARCDSSVNRLLRLANDLLDIEKLESGKMKMHFETAPLAYVLEQSMITMQGQAESRGIRLEVPQTEISIYADADRLVQVLVNLISNGLKYSPEKSTVRVDLKDVGDWVEVRIQDQGPGIPADYRDRMFQRFQQVDVAERKKYGGTGLGLAICKEIVGAHNGTIGIDSSEGAGSIFWFRVPKTEGAMQKAAPGDR